MRPKIAKIRNYEAGIDSLSNSIYGLSEPLYRTELSQAGRQNTIPQVNYIPI